MNEKDKRTVSVMLKLTQAEKDMLDTLIAKTGESLSGYVRRIIYEKHAEVAK